MLASFRFVLVGLSLVGLAACTEASAATRGGDDPKAIPTTRSLQSVRDSVFHSYLDSLDLRIETLNKAAHTVDSLAPSLRAMPSLKLHVNGHCFGPIHIPSQTVGSDSVSVETPEVNIPEIEIPDLDIEFPWSETIPGQSIQGMTSGSTDSYYYSLRNKRYYIRNVIPRIQAKRAANGPGVWLLDPK